MHYSHKYLALIITPVACMLVGDLALSQTRTDTNRRQGPHVYIGGSTGLYKWQEGDFDEDRNLWETYVGLAFNDYIAVEANYTQLGEIENDFVSAEIDGWSPVVVGTLPLTRYVDVFGKLGRYYWEADVETLGFSDTLDGDENFYTLGTRFKITDPLQFSLEYTRYDVDLEAPAVFGDLDEAKVDAVKAGLNISF